MNLKVLALNGSSVLLGVIFFTAGMAKLFYDHRFPGIIGPVWLEERLIAHQLGLFARFVAYAQVLTGFLLLTLRYRTLGAIMLLPMLLSIFIVTVSLEWQGTPYVLAALLLLNLALLLAGAPKLLHLVGFGTAYTPKPCVYPATMGLVWLAGFCVVLAAISISNFSLIGGYALTAVGLLLGLLPYLKVGRID